MKRLVLAMILLMLLAASAGAHSLSTTATFSMKGTELTVQVTDVYGAAVEGAKGTAATGAPGKRTGQKAPLTEVEPGIYRGTITPPGTDSYDLLVEITVYEDLFRGSLTVKAGSDLPETQVPMVAIDPPLRHSAWGPVLYGAAALVLVVATVIAIRRQRGGEDEEE